MRRDVRDSIATTAFFVAICLASCLFGALLIGLAALLLT
jgi:hypothetical protein